MAWLNSLEVSTRARLTLDSQLRQIEAIDAALDTELVVNSKEDRRVQL
jgi:hypothetical protein